MIHLRSVALRPPPDGQQAVFPFSVPAIRSLSELTFPSPVTFFVGENGSGKSTLLEGLAAATGLPTVGSEHVRHDETLAAQRELARALRLVWNARTTRGFFLRAEDFFGFARSVSRMRIEFQRELARIDEEYHDRSPEARDSHECRRRDHWPTWSGGTEWTSTPTRTARAS